MSLTLSQDSTLTTPRAPDPASRGGVAPAFRVLVAGGGVAALEALLGLHEINDGSLELEMICPDTSFRLRALSVAEPFGSPPARQLDLAEFCGEHGISLRRDALAEVWGEQQRVLLDSGEEIFYDALLLAFGARRREALPGAHAFGGSVDVSWFSGLIRDVERGAIRQLTFAVPASVRWSLPLYELALMTAHGIRERGAPETELRLVTHEPRPLEVFGAAVSDRLAGLLEDAGVELTTGRTPVDFDGEILHLADGPGIDTGCVVALPEPFVPSVPGLPQGSRGFIGCDPTMRVEGMRLVWVAGDASWLPIKQGGLAAQEADVAVADIAASAGFQVEARPFRPVIRGALLTGDAPRFLRADLGSGEEGTISESPLWWPPIKVAAPRLAPYLAARWDGDPVGRLMELEDLEGSGLEGAAGEDHREALGLALRFADIDAREGELEDALRWLDVAERLNVTLPFDYVDRREQWRRRVDEAASPSRYPDRG